MHLLAEGETQLPTGGVLGALAVLLPAAAAFGRFVWPRVEGWLQIGRQSAADRLADWQQRYKESEAAWQVRCKELVAENGRLRDDLRLSGEVREQQAHTVLRLFEIYGGCRESWVELQGQFRLRGFLLGRCNERLAACGQPPEKVPDEPACRLPTAEEAEFLTRSAQQSQAVVRAVEQQRANETGGASGARPAGGK